MVGRDAVAAAVAAPLGEGGSPEGVAADVPLALEKELAEAVEEPDCGLVAEAEIEARAYDGVGGAEGEGRRGESVAASEELAVAVVVPVAEPSALTEPDAKDDGVGAEGVGGGEGGAVGVGFLVPVSGAETD